MTDFSTVAHDDWDADDWTASQETFPRLREVELDLLEVATLGPWLLGDVFHLLHKALPQLRDETPMRAALNRSITERLIDGQLDDLRRNTVGDTLLTSVALAQLAGELSQLLADAQRVQDAADEAADAQERYEEACGEAGEEPGSDHAPGSELAGLAEAAGTAAQEAAGEAAAMGPVVASAVASAVDAASDAVDKLCEAAAGWGIGADAGESGVTDPADRLALLERLATDEMAELARLIGRMRFDRQAEVGSRWDTGPGEITSIVASDDLGRLTSGELINLAVPELRPLFYDRYLTKQLLCLHLEEPQREAAGSIVYLEDSSGTMKGARTRWARAVGWRLLETAVEQRRGFRAVVFAGVGSLRVFDFGDDASTSTMAERLAYAEFTMTGRTDFQGPLLTALTLIEDEHDRTGLTRADIVLATDGISELTDEFHNEFDERREALGFRCYGISIQHPVTDTLRRLCDRITSEDRLSDGGNLTDLFDHITQEPVTA